MQRVTTPSVSFNVQKQKHIEVVVGVQLRSRCVKLLQDSPVTMARVTTLRKRGSAAGRSLAVNSVCPMRLPRFHSDRVRQSSGGGNMVKELPTHQGELDRVYEAVTNQLGSVRQIRRYLSSFVEWSETVKGTGQLEEHPLEVPSMSLLDDDARRYRDGAELIAELVLPYVAEQDAVVLRELEAMLPALGKACENRARELESAAEIVEKTKLPEEREQLAFRVANLDFTPHYQTAVSQCDAVSSILAKLRARVIDRLNGQSASIEVNEGARCDSAVAIVESALMHKPFLLARFRLISNYDGLTPFRVLASACECWKGDNPNPDVIRGLKALRDELNEIPHGPALTISEKNSCTSLNWPE